MSKASKKKEGYDVDDIIVLDDKKKKDEFDLGREEFESGSDDDDSDFDDGYDFDDGGD